MDVRIGTIDTTIVDTGGGGGDDALVQRVARRVMAMLERQLRSEQRARTDRSIASPDDDDVEDYG